MPSSSNSIVMDATLLNVKGQNPSSTTPAEERIDLVTSMFNSQIQIQKSLKNHQGIFKDVLERIMILEEKVKDNSANKTRTSSSTQTYWESEEVKVELENKVNSDLELNKADQNHQDQQETEETIEEIQRVEIENKFFSFTPEPDQLDEKGSCCEEPLETEDAYSLKEGYTSIEDNTSSDEDQGLNQNTQSNSKENGDFFDFQSNPKRNQIEANNSPIEDILTPILSDFKNGFSIANQHIVRPTTLIGTKGGQTVPATPMTTPEVSENKIDWVKFKEEAEERKRKLLEEAGIRIREAKNRMGWN